MFQRSCDSTWILVLHKDCLHQGRIKIYSSRLEPETRPINLLLHSIISVMREQRQFYSPIYGELVGIYPHPLDSAWGSSNIPPSGQQHECFLLPFYTLYKCTHTHTHSDTYTLTLMHTHMYTHSHTHTLIHTCARTHTDLHVHTHTHAVGKEEIFFFLLLADLKIKLTCDRLTRKIKWTFNKMY